MLGNNNTNNIKWWNRIYIIKIVKFLEDSGLLLKWICEKIQNKVKEQKGGFLFMLLRTLGPRLLENMLTDKGVVRAGYGSDGSFSKDF